MLFDCTLFSEELKKKILEELSDKLNISIQDLELSFLVYYFQHDTLNLDELQKKALIKALSRTSGNITKTAELLGVSRKTVYTLIKKYGIVSYININDY